MAVPFDTLKLARRFEAAGFEHKQAGDISAAIADAITEANLSTKAGLKSGLALDSTEGKLTALLWMVGINIAAAIGILGMLIPIMRQLGEIAALLTRLAK